jgi:HTH-type transcriptional regulator / antitoxin HigA
MNDRKSAEVFMPGEFIKEELEVREWSQIELAEIIGRPPSVVTDLILGKRAISPEIAKALGDAFGTSAQYWMNLESIYQLWHIVSPDSAIARRSKLYSIAPIKEMTKRHWIEPSENIEVLESRVINFFNIKSLDNPIQMAHAARKGKQETSSVSQNAWLFRARQLAHGVYAKSFSDRSFNDALKQLKNVLHNVQEIRHVPRILADNGIRLLILEHLPQTRIDGVTFWLDNKSPVIALSLRYDRIDAFWFTLAHELGHVRAKDGLTNMVIIDTETIGDDYRDNSQISDTERKADLFATEFLIDQKSLDDFILRTQPLYGKTKILRFANKIGVHPGIVVGQLHHRQEIPFTSFRVMLEKIKNIIIPSTLTDGWGQTITMSKAMEA